MKSNCEVKYCKNKSNSLYIKRILHMIGPVILGSKPAEIVNIPGSSEEKIMKIYQIKSFFSNCCKVKFIVINTHDGEKEFYLLMKNLWKKYCLIKEV